MRLSARDREIIRQVTTEVTGGKGTAYVFGSRLNDSAKGGDWGILVRLRESGVPAQGPVNSSSTFVYGWESTLNSPMNGLSIARM